MRRTLCCLFVLLLLSGCRQAPDRTRLVLAATTSLEDTGLLDLLASEFERAHPTIDLAPIAVGTGQAIQLGRRHDADVLISHDSAGEMQLVREGAAKERRSVMYNDFVIAGPRTDPVGIRGTSAIAAFSMIRDRRAMFISRGDDSGTHRRELAIWREAAIEPTQNPNYIEAAVGMGDALLMAGQKRAYILTDRGTYMRYRQRVELDILVENDPPLFNRYGVTILNGRHAKEAEVFADWLTSARVQRMIGDYGKDEFGRPLFEPSADGAAPHDTIPTGER